MTINQQARIVTLALFTILMAAPAVAGNRECGPGRVVLTGPISDNVIFPSGSVCIIERAQIDGYVTVEPSGHVRMANSTVSGNFKLGAGTSLQVVDAGDEITPSVIGGNLRADGAIDILQDCLCPLIIQGNVSLDN